MSHRLYEVARGAAGAGEEAADGLYEVAGRLLAAHRYRGAANPALVRAALEADEDVPDGPDFKGMVHLVAAIGLGAQEVGADALAEAFAAFDLFGLTGEDWAQMLGAVERDEGPRVDWGLLQQRADVLGPLQQASDEELLRARRCCSGCGGSTGCTPCTLFSCRIRRRWPRCGRGSTSGACSRSWTTSSL
jgi:hypothetical protein